MWRAVSTTVVDDPPLLSHLLQEAGVQHQVVRTKTIYSLLILLRICVYLYLDDFQFFVLVDALQWRCRRV